MATRSVTICDVTGEEVDLHFKVEFCCDGGCLKLDLSKAGASRLVMALAEEAGPEAISRALDSALGPKWRSLIVPSR